MNYQVTARKWRPQDFSQVVGQEHVTISLTNAINSGKVPHAYLFSGPRGVGKTSTARILSKLLNCIHSPNICGQCDACLEISSGQSLDVREIDGASNRGIEQIREIRDNAVYSPLSLKYKIFIIDEVHMLTKEASNALLKILEEPPNHVIFMLATTEANKVLPTIRSRCQHYLLKRIPLDTLVEKLSYILDQEGHTYEIVAVEEIAHAGDGSMRDSQTILDQVILYTQGNLTLTATREVLGIPDTVYFENILKGCFTQDIILMLDQCNTYLTEVGDGISFAENLTKFLRKALLVKKLPPNHPLLEISQEKYQEFSAFLTEFTDEDLITLLNLALELCSTLRQEVTERFWVESTIFKMFDYRNRISLSELRQEMLKVIGRNADSSSLQTKIIPQTQNKTVDATQVNSSIQQSVSIKESGSSEKPFSSMFDDHLKNKQKTNKIKNETILDSEQKLNILQSEPVHQKIQQKAFSSVDLEQETVLKKEDIVKKKIPDNISQLSGSTIEDTIKNLFEV